MPFLSGSLGFERFNVTGFESQEFGEEQLAKLAQFASGKFESNSTESTQVGFLGGEHLFDTVFDLGKNVINNALHCGITGTPTTLGISTWPTASSKRSTPGWRARVLFDALANPLDLRVASPRVEVPA